MSSAFCAVKTAVPGIDPGLNDVFVGALFLSTMPAVFVNVIVNIRG